MQCYCVTIKPSSQASLILCLTESSGNGPIPLLHRATKKLWPSKLYTKVCSSAQEVLRFDFHSLFLLGPPHRGRGEQRLHPDHPNPGPRPAFALGGTRVWEAKKQWPSMLRYAPLNKCSEDLGIESPPLYIVYCMADFDTRQSLLLLLLIEINIQFCSVDRSGH